MYGGESGSVDLSGLKHCIYSQLSLLYSDSQGVSVMKRLFFYEGSCVCPKIPSRSEDQEEWSKVVFN